MIFIHINYILNLINNKEGENSLGQHIENPNKWALLIGINEYPNFEADDQLDGCINDIENIANILEMYFSFPNNNLMLLRNEEATRDNILTNLEILIEKISNDDIVVIYYCGHGSQMTDREGDEPDGLDETIVPYDSGRFPKENKDITDDELYIQILRMISKTPYITLIFDCCHSGTISRDIFGGKIRNVKSDLRSIHELPRSHIKNIDYRKKFKNSGPSGWLPLHNSYLLIAACKDEEESFEYHHIEGDKIIPYGAFTYVLCQELIKTKQKTTYRDIFEKITTRMSTINSRQHPQMEGEWDRELFGTKKIKPLRFILVKERQKNRVKLQAGAALGMKIGSQWAVYPPMTKQITEKTEKLGLIEIIDVDALFSEAEILEETKVDAIIENSRAIEEIHDYGKLDLKVEIKSPNDYKGYATKLAHQLESSPLLSVVRENKPSNVRIYLVTPRNEIKEDDPVPQLGLLKTPIWVVIQDGFLLMPTYDINDNGVEFKICENLEKLVRYRQTLNIQNPKETNILKDKVDFKIIRQNNKKEWIKAKPDLKAKQILFEEGEFIAFEVSNHSKIPIFVSLLDFGLTGAITLLYPIQGASEKLIPNKTFQIGVRQGEEIELFLPNNFPFQPDPNDLSTFGGNESFKLLITTQEADFSMLLQPGYRSPKDKAKTKLEELMEMTIIGKGNRDAKSKINRLSSKGEWLTIEKNIYLKQKESV